MRAGELVAGPRVQTNLLLQFGTVQRKREALVMKRAGRLRLCTSGHKWYNTLAFEDRFALMAIQLISYYLIAIFIVMIGSNEWINQ